MLRGKPGCWFRSTDYLIFKRTKGKGKGKLKVLFVNDILNFFFSLPLPPRNSRMQKNSLGQQP